MDDRRLEELLRDSWSPLPPEGMRERVLRRSREELARRRPRIAWLVGWKPALAAVAVLFVLMMNISDYATSRRIAALTDGVTTKITAPAGPDTMLRQRMEMAELLAQAPASRTDSLKGENLL